MAEQMYKQVKLRKLLEGTSSLTQTCWLPNEHARVGKTVQLKKVDNAWDDGWMVEEVFPGARRDVDIDAIRKAHKRFEEVLGG